MEDIDSVAKTISGTIDSLGQIELSGIKLEEARPELLDINSLTLDIHVAMQPAALAYYGQLRKIAMRRLEDIKNKRERWMKAKYAETKSSCLQIGSKATVADIEAKLITDNIDAINKADEAERHAQEVFDTLDAWYDAWKQKGYSIREHISMEMGEKANSDSSIVVDAPVSLVRREAVPSEVPGDSLDKLGKKFAKQA